MLMFSAENPDKIQGFDGEVDKGRLERFHLECYRADHVLQFGDVPFEEVIAGDRPDFAVTVGGQHVRLDCAALADHHRRLGFPLQTGLGFEVQLSMGAHVTYGSADRTCSYDCGECAGRSIGVASGFLTVEG